jgi:hypothetical protein
LPWANLASFNVGIDAGIGISFKTDVSAVVGADGPQLGTVTFAPSVDASLKGFGELDIGQLGPFTVAKAGISVDGELTQNLVATYSGGNWFFDAPGSLSLEGSLYWDTALDFLSPQHNSLWGGEKTLFSWPVANWNFITQTGNSSQQTGGDRTSYSSPVVQLVTPLSSDPNNPTLEPLRDCPEISVTTLR